MLKRITIPWLPNATFEDYGSLEVVKVKDQDHGVLSHGLQTLVATGTKAECNAFCNPDDAYTEELLDDLDGLG